MEKDGFAKWSGLFILSLFLLVGSIGWTSGGMARWYFWHKHKNQSVPQAVDVTQNGSFYPDGYVQVTGVAGHMVAADFGPYNPQDLSTSENYYFPLIGKERLIRYVVQHKESRLGKLWLYPNQKIPTPPTVGVTTTVTGIAGWYMGEIPSEAVDNLIAQGYAIALDAKLLAMDSKPPTSKTLVWYIVPLIFSLAGMVLLVWSVRKLKPYVL